MAARSAPAYRPYLTYVELQLVTEYVQAGQVTSTSIDNIVVGARILEKLNKLLATARSNEEGAIPVVTSPADHVEARQAAYNKHVLGQVPLTPDELILLDTYLWEHGL